MCYRCVVLYFIDVLCCTSDFFHNVVRWCSYQLCSSEISTLHNLDTMTDGLFQSYFLYFFLFPMQLLDHLSHRMLGINMHGSYPKNLQSFETISHSLDVLRRSVSYATSKCCFMVFDFSMLRERDKLELHTFLSFSG